MKKEVIFLCGLPCTGKTTHRKKFYPNHAVVSGDDVTEALAEKYGLKYDDFYISMDEGQTHPRLGKATPNPVGWMSAFRPWVPERVAPALNDWNMMCEAQKAAALLSDRAIVDMTNLSIGARSRLLNLFKEEGFKTKAIWFISFSLSRQIEIIQARSERLGDKSIPAKRIIEMHRGFQIPEEGEFDEVEIITPEF